MLIKILHRVKAFFGVEWSKNTMSIKSDSYKTSYLSSAGIIGLATMLSRVLGLVREQVIAYFFGAGMAADAFNTAFRIPNLLRDLFAEGAMSSALVPVYTKTRKQEGEEAAWQMVANLRAFLGVVLIIVASLGIVFAEPLVRLYAGGFESVPGKIALTTSLTQIMFPYLALVAMAAVAMGVLNARKKFALPALSPATFNIASIFAAFVICPWVAGYDKPPIYGMAIGVILGGMLQWWMQMPLLYREGFRERLRVSLFDPRLRKVLALMSVGIAGMAATQLNIFVNTRLASHEAPGAVSWLQYAFRFMQLPIGVFGVAIAQVTLSRASDQAADKDMEGLKQTVVRSVRMAWALTIPSAAGLYMLAPHIVEVIYEHGRFSAQDTLNTASALSFYAFGLAAYAANKVLVPIFYSVDKVRVPVVISFVSVGLNLVFCLLFLPVFGFAGLALGVSLSAISQCILLILFLGRTLGGIAYFDILRGMTSYLFASAVMVLLLWWLTHEFNAMWKDATRISQIILLTCGVMAGAGTYYAIAKVLRINEVEYFTRFLLRKIKKK